MYQIIGFSDGVELKSIFLKMEKHVTCKEYLLIYYKIQETQVHIVFNSSATLYDNFSAEIMYFISSEATWISTMLSAPFPAIVYIRK